MKTIISKLEDNLFSGVLVKKGLNIIKDDIYRRLCGSKQFKQFCEGKYIEVTEAENGAAQGDTKDIKDTKDFGSMSYSELKAYVLENNIKVKSLKKADILEALTKGE